jgi:hypothetical protein
MFGWTWTDGRGSTSVPDFDLKVRFAAVNSGYQTFLVGR